MIDDIFSVLIVDDNHKNLQVLARIIKSIGCEPILATNGNQVFDFLSKYTPNLILLEVMMPEMDGYEVAKRLKNNSKYKDIPFIFITAKSDIEDIVKGFEYGGVDYITKPFNVVELKARIKTHLELKRSHDALIKYNEQLEKANDIIAFKNLQLSQMMRKLENASKTDHLTGLFNRRYMMEKIDNEIQEWRVMDFSLSVVIADVDLFKNINDTYGHDCGDYVLKELSKCIMSSIRETDSVARWGGEEVLFLLPNTKLNEAIALIERLRKNIQNYVFCYGDAWISISMTFGIAHFSGNERIDDTIKRADRAFYKGKRSGRNCVVTFE